MTTKLIFISMFVSTLMGCNVQTTEETKSKSQPTAETVSRLTDAEVELISQLETGLIRSVAVEGNSIPTYTISERMAYFNTPAVSIAYAKGGKIIWAKGYGEGIDSTTLFQAASLSKAVSATGMVSFAMNNNIDLDADVDALLPNVDISSINPEGKIISLRGLLSHTAGATVHGFPGYGIGDDVPTNLQVILGSDISNSDAVVIAPDSKKQFRYSGGGFQIAQAVIEAQSKQPFETTMAAHVLEPIGMSASSFALRAPGSSTDGTALATDGSGSPIDGGWHVYPEQAAAALWTTPTDYLKFMLALITASEDGSPKGLSARVAIEVLTPVSEDYGLGIGVENSEGRLQYNHGGSNRGYRCFVKAFPDTGEVLIVMTNAPSGSLLGSEIFRSASKTYNWPGGKPKMVKRYKLSELELTKFVGSYALPDKTDAYLELSVGKGDLTVKISEELITFSLMPISDNRFIDLDDGEELEFRLVDNTMIMDASGTLLTRLSAN